MRFKVGDKILVHPDMKKIRSHTAEKLCGRIATIVRAANDVYALDLEKELIYSRGIWEDEALPADMTIVEKVFYEV